MTLVALGGKALVPAAGEGWVAAAAGVGGRGGAAAAAANGSSSTSSSSRAQQQQQQQALASGDTCGYVVSVPMLTVLLKLVALGPAALVPQQATATAAGLVFCRLVPHMIHRAVSLCRWLSVQACVGQQPSGNAECFSIAAAAAASHHSDSSE
jgi:hypothetical protein